MTRFAFISMVPFFWGSPQFSDLRPQALDLPLRNYHTELKEMAGDAVMMLGVVQEFHQMGGAVPQLAAMNRL